MDLTKHRSQTAKRKARYRLLKELASNTDSPTDLANPFKDTTALCGLFVHLFDVLPSRLSIEEVEYEKLTSWFETEYATEIEERLFRKSYEYSAKGYLPVDSIFILRNQMIVRIEVDDSVVVYFDAGAEAQASQLLMRCLSFRIKPKAEPAVHLVVGGSRGLSLQKVRFKAPRVIASGTI